MAALDVDVPAKDQLGIQFDPRFIQGAADAVDTFSVDKAFVTIVEKRKILIARIDSFFRQIVSRAFIVDQNGRQLALFVADAAENDFAGGVFQCFLEFFTEILPM